MRAAGARLGAGKRSERVNSAEDTEERDPLTDEAAKWVIRVQSEAATENDWLSLEAWLATSPEHLAAFGRAEALWRELEDRADELRPLLQEQRPSGVVELPASRRQRQSVRQWRAPAAVAASLAIGLFGLWLNQPFGVAPKDYSTRVGERRNITLADGSRVTLNSASRMTARVDPRHRRVTMVAGEAVFDVAKDHAHPFVVAVGDQDVTVVGTEFDILRYAGRVVVTVSRGVVTVQPRDESGQLVRLVAGDQLSHAEGDTTSDLTHAAASDVLAWRDGYAVYTHRTLADVAADLSRYFAIPIVARGPAARLIFTGALRIDREDEVIRRLVAFMPVKAVPTPQAIVLQAR